MSIYVEPTPTPPAKFGLLEAAALQPGAGRWQMGVQFEPTCGLAHLTVGACQPQPLADTDVGLVTVTVDDSRVATLNGPLSGEGAYIIDWDDGSSTTGGTLTNRTHTYTADANPTVTIDGPGTYQATIVLTVTDGVASGPFQGMAFDTTPANKDTGWDSSLIEADPFAVYHLAECRAVGGWAQAEARARRSFEQAEGRAVEEWFSAFLSAHTGGVDLTPVGGAVPSKYGLAALEKYAGTNFGGTPTIHGSRDAVTLLIADAGVKANGNRLETGLGSRVAAGAGYTLGEPGAPAGAVPTGESWLYVTGGVYVWRGDLIITDQVMNLSNEGGSNATNEFRLLVERPYVVATECIVAGIRVEVSEEVPT